MNTLFILINSLMGRSEVFGNSAFSSNRKGFTLIEQLIVTVTIGILMAVAIPIRDAEASSTVKYKYNGVVRNTSGDHVENATITVFIANTNPIIPLDVYETQDSETAVSSVTSDSEGFFEFWLDYPTDDSEYTTSDIFNIEITYEPVDPNPTPLPESYNVNNISIFPTIQDGSITHEKLSNDAVTSDKIDADAVTSNKIGDDQVRWNHIADKSIQTIHIVGYDNMRSDGITPHKGAVTTPKIRNNAVTLEKLADDAIAFPRRLYWNSTGYNLPTRNFTDFNLSLKSGETILSYDLIELLFTRQDNHEIEIDSPKIPTVLIPTSVTTHYQIGVNGPRIYRVNNLIYLRGLNTSITLHAILGYKWKN